MLQASPQTIRLYPIDPDPDSVRDLALDRLRAALALLDNQPITQDARDVIVMRLFQAYTEGKL